MKKFTDVSHVINSRIIEAASVLDGINAYKRADAIDRMIARAMTGDMRRSPEHQKRFQNIEGYAKPLQTNIDDEFQSGFHDYNTAVKDFGPPPLVHTKDLTKMYDALEGAAPYEMQQATAGENNLNDEDNLKRLQWQNYVDQQVNAMGDKMHYLLDMMYGLYLKGSITCPECGDSLLTPNEREEYEYNKIAEGAYVVHCNTCGEDFISYDGDEGVFCEICGSQDTSPAEDPEPYNLINVEDLDLDAENYYCPTCDTEYPLDEINIKFPVDASGLASGEEKSSVASTKNFLSTWSHDLPLPQKIVLVQRMLMAVHGSGALFNRFFGINSAKMTVELMKFLDVLSGNDLSKWENKEYAEQRLKKPWER